MLPLNREPETLAQRLGADAWRNIAKCAIKRHAMASQSRDFDRSSGEAATCGAATDLIELALNPFSVSVADGIASDDRVPSWDRLFLDRDWHLTQAINGETLELPSYLESAISDEDMGWQDKVCEYLKALDDRNRDYSWDRLEITGEHDVSGDILAVTFVPVESADRYWSQDTFIACDGKLQKMDGAIGDSGILDYRIGWYVADLQDGDYLADCESETQRYSVGYSSDPTHELERDLIGVPTWHYGLHCFVGRLRFWPHPVRLYPETPCYGG